MKYLFSDQHNQCVIFRTLFVLSYLNNDNGQSHIGFSLDLITNIESN